MFDPFNRCLTCGIAIPTGRGACSDHEAPPTRLSVVITETFGDVRDAAETLRHIADLLDDDYTSGFHPGWELADVPAVAAAGAS